MALRMEWIVLIITHRAPCPGAISLGIPLGVIGVAPETLMHQKKILVVDDSQLILKLMSMKLTACGYEVITAEDGGTAVSAVRNERPDLILLDISFPPDVAHGGGVAWDGFAIMAWLRRLEEGKNVPIIVISGAEPAKLKARALAAGAAAYYHKPIDTDALLVEIRRTLGESAEDTASPGASQQPKS